jgi:hypothetical protein
LVAQESISLVCSRESVAKQLWTKTEESHL